MRPNLTLQNIIDSLRQIKHYKPLVLENAYSEGKWYNDITLVDIQEYEIDPHRAGVGVLDSWRGDYRQFALAPKSEVKTVIDTIMNLDQSINNTFQGYKGGDFVATPDVDIWVAGWGDTYYWTRTDKTYKTSYGEILPCAVKLAVVDVIDRDNEAVILYEEQDCNS